MDKGKRMYVCICNAYRDSEIAGVARSGVRCARQAYSMLGNGPQCGQCLSLAQALIDDVHGAAVAPEGTMAHRLPAMVQAAGSAS